MHDVDKRFSENLIDIYYHYERVVHNQLKTANYLIPPQATGSENLEKGNTKTFVSNKQIWDAIIKEKIRDEMTVRLDRFLLFEWFPRTPGLYHTSAGEQAREEAMRKYVLDIRADGTIVYDPHGKASMLDGGIGNIRLRPIIVNKRKLYLMSASSSGVCHEGVPIALSSDLYGQCIEQITDRGAVACSLIGKLKFVPKKIVELYLEYTEVPQLYLEVDEVLPPTYKKNVRELRVSVAVSFASNFEGSKKVYASYVNFDPSDKRSMEESIKWINNDYVIGKYNGQVVTDFDEQRSHFANAPFSLKKIMSLDLDRKEIAAMIERLPHCANADHKAGLIVQKVENLKIEIGYVEELVKMKNEINQSGSGVFITNVAEYMSGVTNQVRQQVNESTAPDEVKALLKQLTEQIAVINPSINPEKTKQMVGDLKTLSDEIIKAEPRRKWYEMSLEGIKEAAIAVGEIGKPILETVTKLLPLLVPGSS